MQRTMGRGSGGGFYQRFLQMPLPAVLAVMWLAGAVIITACFLALYVLMAPLAGT